MEKNDDLYFLREPFFNSHKRFDYFRPDELSVIRLIARRPLDEKRRQPKSTGLRRKKHKAEAQSSRSTLSLKRNKSQMLNL